MDNVKNSLVEKIIYITKESLLQEVTAHPKFGLVTKISSGKHKDMNYNTFIESIDVLEPYFKEYAYCGFDFGKDTFDKLREIGKRAEVDLLKKTEGVNTYKGIIFLLGVLIPSIVDVVYSSKSFEDIQKNIKSLCTNILDDFQNIESKETLTYGEKIYLDYGITGIRGVAKSGIDIAFTLERKFELNEDINDLVINILLNSMSILDDTVILHKNSIETLNYIKYNSLEIIGLGGFSTEVGKKNVNIFTKECIRRNISPGGSADIVSVVLILLKIREKYFNNIGV